MSHCYGTLSVYSPAQSFVELLTIAEVVAHLGLPVRMPPDEAEAAMLGMFISAARVQAEIAQEGRIDLVPKQYDLALDFFPCGEIQLRGPLVSVDLVRYRDSDGNYTTLTEDTHYIVDTARGLVMPAYGETWPSFTAWPSSAVLVRYTCGYTASHSFWNDTGSSIKAGMLYLISAWYNNRLPFEAGANAIAEYPFTVKACLTAGAVPRVRA